MILVNHYDVFSLIVLLGFLSLVLSLHGPAHFISNSTISGVRQGCKHSTPYFINPNIEFKMCTGMSDKDLKNGMTIIKLVESRGYLPTCRVMQLMLWMASEVATDPGINPYPGLMPKDAFIDIGANIGSCSVHMAAMGFPVIAVEPVREHVDTILGSTALNPTFHIEVHHAGISHVEKHFRVKYFGHGFRNWGATNLIEAEGNETAEAELQMRTTDQIIGHRKVSLVKIDCEGCELQALLGAKKNLKRIPMIKMELVQPEYTAGNITMNPAQIIEYLNENNFEVFIDYWNEQDLYFGRHGNLLMEVDQIFGSNKFKLGADFKLMNDCAKRILSSPIDHKTFQAYHRTFLKKYTDIIAIEKSLAVKMKKHFGVELPAIEATVATA